MTVIMAMLLSHSYLFAQDHGSNGDDHEAEAAESEEAHGHEAEAAESEGAHGHEAEAANAEETDGHGGHNHATTSFASYGLVKSEKGLKVFNLKLDRFSFTPEVIRVNKGDRVRLNLDSIDVEHGFFIDGFAIEVKVPEKGFKTVEFTADEFGAFRFRCTSTCGQFHPFMIGKIVVGPNYPFWGSLAGVVFFPAGFAFYKTTKGKRNDEKGRRSDENHRTE